MRTMTVTAQRGTHRRWYTPHRAAVLAAVVAGCIWLVVLPRVLVRLNPLTGDEPFYVMTALSLIREHTLDETRAYTLDRLFLSFYPPTPLPADWQGWPSFPNPLPPHAAHSRLPGLHTKHGLGLSLLIALPWALGGRLLTELTLLAIAVLVTANMGLLASEAGAPPWLAALLAAALAVVMPIGPYAFLIFPELPAALALLYAVRRLGAPANARWQWLLAGLGIGFLPWLHQRFVFSAAILGLVALGRLVQAWRQAADWHRPLLAVVPAALGGLGIVAYNLWLYGTPWENPADHAGFSGLVGTLNGAAGLLLDAQWGLWVAAPVTILALAALPWWLAADRSRAQLALAALAPYLILVAAYRVWWGEWGPPARYLVPVVPFAAGSLGAWLSRAHGWSARLGWLIGGLLWLWGAALTVVGYLDPQRFYHHPDGANKLVKALTTSFGHDLSGWLVAYQFYHPSPVPLRLAAAALAASAVLLALVLVGPPPTRQPSPQPLVSRYNEPSGG
ncbi:MAG: hypothetical protein IRY86_05430 [Thermorudis peleae]|nr:hypothetical protein [Thermorudis peleae]